LEKGRLFKRIGLYRTVFLDPILKYLGDLETERAMDAGRKGKAYTYTYIIDAKHRWFQWAAPKGKDGSSIGIKPWCAMI